MLENDPEQQKLLTPRQVADRLQVGIRTLWRLAEQDAFPKPIRFNRKLVRWKSADVQRYLDSLPAENDAR